MRDFAKIETKDKSCKEITAELNIFLSGLDKNSEIYLDRVQRTVLDDKVYPVIRALNNDHRLGVKKLVKKVERKYEEIINKLDKYETMSIYENGLKSKGYKLIAGIDEAGRGPLAGPVVAAAVVLGDWPILGLDDSKKLSSKERDILYDEIQKRALYIGVEIIDNVTIDKMNILSATKIGMVGAVKKLKVKPEMLLIDALKIDVNIDQIEIIKGDSKSNSIAAASIIAKVTRDRIMEKYDKTFPGYEFAKHKGYGTKLHYEKIRLLGPSPIHRKTFL